MYNSYLNIRTMCHHAHKYNAIGLLNTDWGDYGHVNDPRLTIPGILYGAAFGWNAEPVEFDELNEAVSRLYYGDTTGQFAGLMAKLQDYEVFDWRNTVNWIECDEKTRAEILSEVDFTRIDDANRAVEKAKADILAAAVNLPAGKSRLYRYSARRQTSLCCGTVLAHGSMQAARTAPKQMPWQLRWNTGCSATVRSGVRSAKKAACRF